MSSVIYNMFCHPIRINGHANHIHIAVEMSPGLSINLLVKELQQNAKDFLSRENAVFPEFNGWESGFIAISYHPDQIVKLEEHIKNQFDYHRKISFEEELAEYSIVKDKA